MECRLHNMQSQTLPMMHDTSTSAASVEIEDVTPHICIDLSLIHI